ncbi:D-alanyl-D-alanine carboxypeptidase family protein [Actinokineospora globicatena]|uniref:D-alanyl-D-alanine carboxypeptidase family protein n=1 Tax=Actinokineospora globicatena TaxID=103729 RepID=UPI0020A49A3F|nr:D-alanyl-D-alanine carboxypeptidase family protein [Actinokineospora globicatena]MCP2301987.1 D-alanyl-D-alanine carboxypeptidase (penicillin-binding protein 5/6) [Actinokineospora globicatena]GLW76351.1 D-alanyl-D-alanine carboxypeptidase [Actinokineospora globicatena]
MRFAARRTVTAFLVPLCALLFGAVLATPVAAQPVVRKGQQQTTGTQAPSQNSAQCQNHDRPPPPVDTSEEPKPGQPSPEPLPVPKEPVGGTRMGECGLVVPNGAKAAIAGDITSASWVIADLDTGEVLAAKDPHARERPASLIKTLLAVVVIRELRLDEVVTGTQEDANQEGTKVGIGPGGQYTVRQLLFALLMRSGNDAAHALAAQLGGVPKALDKMNALAKELGAFDTRAATPSGLDGPGMSTSAYDLSLVFRAAMKHKEFAEAIGTKSLDFPGYGTKPGYKVINDNKLLGRYQGFTGGKTGFTDDARHTYVGGAKRGTARIAVVLLRGELNPNPLAEQASRLLDYGFALAAENTKGVGQLVDHAPEAQPKQGTGLGTTSASDSQQPTNAANTNNDALPPDAQRSAFGNFGAPLVGLAGVAILVSFALWFRRKRARAARARRVAAG